MNLLEIAPHTEDIGASLIKFIKPVPAHSVNLATVVSELFSISASLRILANFQASAIHRPRFILINDDLQLVYASLRHTLRDIYDALNRMTAAARGLDVSQSYPQTWSLLWDFFFYQSGNSEKIDVASMARMRQAISDLRAIQDQRYNDSIANQQRQQQQQQQQQQRRQQQHPVPPAPQMPGAYFSAAEQHPEPPPPPPVPDTRRPRTPDLRRRSKNARGFPEMEQRGSWERQRPSSGAGEEPPPRAAPAARTPQPPMSPSFSEESPISSYTGPDSPATRTVSSSSSSSLNEENGVRHWSIRAFGMQLNSSTSLIQTGDITKCFGPIMSGVKEHLAQEYYSLFHLEFPGKPQLTMLFYQRAEDHRTRIVCRVRSSKRRTVYSTIPITSLQIYRSGSCLQLCQKGPDPDEMIAWANLQFSSIEKMVVFFCTFLALRGQDSSKPISNIPDYHLCGEFEVFAGKIVDDNFAHALRVFRDHETKAVRLQATVLDGDLKRVPVWTAFVHPYFRKKSWLRRTGPKTVYLSELQRITFIDSEEYIPPRTRDGKHVLTFTTDGDATGFVYYMEDLMRHTPVR
ncbi:conserved hypothetical protein [Coccidioides posadasii str. Silveira]|uniref:Uncharacterized protein n=1 Tax=Coccidioides posadasii (strain RMSCC 757 / Silveira) TaxID=443226 RepID=E9CYZ2_COCPS|nr:conserved hypothetical protein [Coccidioides posadasii str. Silveira]